MAERHRCEIEIMIDEMIADGRSEQDILTAICKQYEPYDTIPEFGEGLDDYSGAPPRQELRRRRRPSLRPRRQRRHVALVRAAAHEAGRNVIYEISASVAILRLSYISPYAG